MGDDKKTPEPKKSAPTPKYEPPPPRDDGTTHFEGAERDTRKVVIVHEPRKPKAE